MAIIGIRELGRETRSVIERLEADGEPVIITKHGQPVAALIVVDRARLEDLVLSAAPEFVESIREADEALASGATQPLSEVLAELSPPSGSGAAEVESILSGFTDDIAEISNHIADMLGREAESSEVEQIRSLNAELFEAYLTQNLSSTLDRLRTVNETLVAIGKQEGELSTDRYLKLLEGVTVAERLAWPDAGHLDTGQVEAVAELDSTQAT